MAEHANGTSCRAAGQGAISRRRFLLGLVAAGMAYVAPTLLGLDEAEAAPGRPTRRSRPGRRPSRPGRPGRPGPSRPGDRGPRGGVRDGRRPPFGI